MNIEWCRDPANRLTRYTVTLPDAEFQCLQLYEFDKAALNTPLGEGKWAVANALLDLQLIAMRLAQQVEESE